MFNTRKGPTPLEQFVLDYVWSHPACTAEKLMSCFLKPGMELEAMFSEMTSCQRALAFSADAAWYKLTFTRDAKHLMCQRKKRPVFVDSW